MKTSVLNIIGSYTGYLIMLLLTAALVAGQARNDSAADGVRRIEKLITVTADLVALDLDGSDPSDASDTMATDLSTDLPD